MDQDKLGHETSQDESRRKFLKTAGKFAIYTPPALMLMSKSSHATFSKSGHGDKHGDKKKKRRGGKKGRRKYYGKGGRKRRISIWRFFS